MGSDIKEYTAHIVAMQGQVQSSAIEAPKLSFTLRQVKPSMDTCAATTWPHASSSMFRDCPGHIIQVSAQQWLLNLKIEGSSVADLDVADSCSSCADSAAEFGQSANYTMHQRAASGELKQQWGRETKQQQHDRSGALSASAVLPGLDLHCSQRDSFRVPLAAEPSQGHF